MSVKWEKKEKNRGEKLQKKRLILNQPVAFSSGPPLNPSLVGGKLPAQTSAEGLAQSSAYGHFAELLTATKCLVIRPLRGGLALFYG